jgi:hypothetical protein
VDDRIAPETGVDRDGAVLDRGAALRRSGLIFLGGFGAAALAASPALANFSVDHPVFGQGYGSGGGGRGFSALKGHASPALPATYADYADCGYIAIVLKKHDDTNTQHPKHRGIPSADDLAALHIPIPAKMQFMKAYKIPEGSSPFTSGFDELQQYHGASITDADDGGTPLVGDDGPSPTYYDVFLLVYGSSKAGG